jgi:sigma-B regulation protein RsbU (phosphoserine phosphatase)
MSESSSTPGRPADTSPPPPGERLDLSRIRHELRTLVNHILGYTEMLLEEGQLPPSFLQDLRRIHSGGRQLKDLITEYFDEDKFLQQRDLFHLYHELRTPVNHIMGYTELLQEQAAEQGIQAPIADLEKIHTAAGQWLALMEAYLIESPLGLEAPPEGPSDTGAHALMLNLGLGFQVPEPKSAGGAFTDQGALLIVEDDEPTREMLARRLRRYGYTISVAPNGLQALKLAQSQSFDLVLLDMIMPGLDGFQVLAKLKATPSLREIPVIMLSALDEEKGVARSIEMGAEDYLAKPFNPVFLRARIGACLEKKRLRDKERETYEALLRSQKHLAAELAEAAAYVRSLLPAPRAGPVETEWCFQPSEQLGGDAFGYHWVDDGHFAVYLLDVCGHGVGAALLSVSVLNTLRGQTLPGVDFSKPAAVLAALDRTFRMEDQNHLYFTIWYGVYRLKRRELSYASAGHPPALLLAGSQPDAPTVIPLSTPAPAIGCLETASFTSAVQAVEHGARLLLLSDGVFEIFHDDGRVGTWAEFVGAFESREVAALRPEARLRRALHARGADALEDDFSLVEVRFG